MRNAIAISIGVLGVLITCAIVEFDRSRQHARFMTECTKTQPALDCANAWGRR